MYLFLNKFPVEYYSRAGNIVLSCQYIPEIFLPTLKFLLPTYHSHTQTSARLHRIVYNNQAISQL